MFARRNVFAWSQPRTWIVIAVLALIAGELGLRAAGYGRFVLSYSSARYGWRYPPGLEYVDTPSTVTVRINDHGFRDRDWGEARRDPRKLRIAVVGNSVAWGGGGLPIEQRFDRLLEQRLQRELEAAHDVRRIETLDFALPGYTFEQCARIWEDEVRPFAPDLLLVPLLPYDVRPMRPMTDAPRYPFSHWVGRSAVRDFVQRTFLGGWAAGVTPEQRAVENAVRAAPFAPEHAELWRTMFARLDQIRAQAAELGTRVVLVPFPTLDSLLHPDAERTAARVERWAHERGLTSLDPHSAFLGAMRPLLDEVRSKELAPERVWGRSRDPSAGLVHGEDSCYFFHDPDHLSQRGHRVLAEYLTDELTRARLW